MRRATLVAAGLLLLTACAPARASSATVVVTDVTVVLAATSGCTPIVQARITSPVDTELLGATAPREVAAGVSMHVAAGGPTLGGHEGHLDGDGKRHTLTPHTVKVLHGTVTTLSPEGDYLAFDHPTRVLASGDVVALTFRFSNAPEVTASASVTSTGC